MTDRKPQIGEMLILDGITRRITAIDGGRVRFDHPDPEGYEPASKRTWMAKFRADNPDWEKKHPGQRPYDPMRPPFEVSRAGSGPLEGLTWQDGVEFWYWPGRLGLEQPPQADVVIPDVPNATFEGQNP